MRKTITILFFFLLSGISIALAQNITVNGTVVDKTGTALPGVTVTVAATTIGTQTDANGHFSINAPAKGTLRFSFIGYDTKEIAINNQANLNISLQDNSTNLNEVVVVGYGTQSKATVTGAISSVKASELQDQQITRLDDALQGRVSGVSVVNSSGAPGAAPTIRVRGITSINNSDPLYVIDGVIVDNGGIDNINPNDIESIDVLKDASAAIYGSRASNGVILVTTKKGKKGPAKLTYNGYVGWQAPVKKVQLTDASQYAMLRNEATSNDYIDKYGSLTAGPGYVPAVPDPSSYGVGTNWQNEIFSNNAMIQNHNLSISGATDNLNYYTSFGYLDQEGIVMPALDDYKKFTFTNNMSYHVKKWLTIGESLTYTYTHTLGGVNVNNSGTTLGGPISSALNLDPITPVVVNNINAQPNSGIYTQYGSIIERNAQGLPYGISQYVQNELTNPLAFQQSQQGNYNYATNLLGNAFVEVEPITGLKIRSQISAKQAYYGSDSFTPLYYLNAASNNESNTSQYEANNKNLTWNIDNTINYTHSFGLHDVSVLLGQSAQEESGSTLNGTFIGEPVNTLAESSPNFTLPNANKIAGGGDTQPYTLASLFARANYDYDQKYLFTGIIRRDGSSKFGSNHVYGTFPSAEAGYVLSREDFFPKNSFIDFLKIRGSYGTVGNEMSLSSFQYESTMGSGRNAIFGEPEVINIGYSPNAPGNPDLEWEQTTTADIGFDATLIHNLTVTFDVYKKLTKGMLETVQLPSYSGFANSPSANIGDMENKGVELDLGYRNHIGEFKYNVNGNISYNHNELTSLGNQIQYQTDGSVKASSYEIGRRTPGQPIGEFYGFEELGTFKSQAEINNYKNAAGKVIQPNAKPGDFKWADLNGDGVINASDRTFLGNPQPTFNYGININASYKNFDLNIFGQGVWGNKIFQDYRRLDLNTVNYPIAALQAWTPQNPNSNYPRLTDVDNNNNFKNPSNFYLQSGAYFRIKTAQIGYTLPAAWISKADIEKVRVFISSNNLFTITGYNGFDPEVGAAANNNGGIDMGLYPQARTFMVGLDVTL